MKEEKETSNDHNCDKLNLILQITLSLYVYLHSTISKNFGMLYTIVKIDGSSTNKYLRLKYEVG